MTLITQILNSPEFLNKPPVLIDIGASGQINNKWRKIATFSICLAFDADDRDFHVSEETDKGFKKLITFNRIVTSLEQETAPFYLTESPYCSSLLRPDREKLKPWLFSNLFDVKKKANLSTITIENALKSAGISYIDWFKTDTQGTDLRLFKTLPEGVQKTILAAEFEPGIIDAYDGEDKLYSVMQEMHADGFWASTMDVKGTQRMNREYISRIGLSSIKRTIRSSPCWAEVTYLRNPFSGSRRQLLLLMAFALIEKQYGYAIEVADFGNDHFRDGSFDKWKSGIIPKIKSESWKIPLIIAKRQMNKLLSGIND